MTDNDTESFFTITLSRGYVAIVSREDIDLTKIDDTTGKPLIKYSVVSNGRKPYAVRSEPGNNRHKLYLAREIMERKLGRPLIKGEMVKQLNNVPLDYRRSNLYILESNKKKKTRGSDV